MPLQFWQYWLCIFGQFPIERHLCSGQVWLSTQPSAASNISLQLNSFDGKKLFEEEYARQQDFNVRQAMKKLT